MTQLTVALQRAVDAITEVMELNGSTDRFALFVRPVSAGQSRVIILPDDSSETGSGPDAITAWNDWTSRAGEHARKKEIDALLALKRKELLARCAADPQYSPSLDDTVPLPSSDGTACDPT